MDSLAEGVQGLPAEAEFAGEFRGGHALGEAAEQEQNRRGPFVGPVEHGAGEGVEDATASAVVRMAAVPQHRIAFATVNPQRVGRLATRAAQPLGMKERDEFVVTGLLVHQARKGKVHGRRPGPENQRNTRSRNKAQEEVTEKGT